MNALPASLMRPADVRQPQPAQQDAQLQQQEPRLGEAAGAAATQPAQSSAVVTLSAVARGEAAAQTPPQAAPSPDKGTVEARAVEQARAAAASGDVRNNYSAQRALASYEAMSQVGANAAARLERQAPPTPPGQQAAGVLRT
ncbi:hypothetical protein [Thauera sp. WH-1]|uniref:hypothetical protein n=1 Tax=Thauera sp. WH-1 TaxID=3398230 RepID=UPI0039FD91FF